MQLRVTHLLRTRTLLFKPASAAAHARGAAQHGLSKITVPSEMECAFCHFGDDPALGKVVVLGEHVLPVHQVCALWSPNVYQDVNGALKSSTVRAEVKRGEKPVRARTLQPS